MVATDNPHTNWQNAFSTETVLQITADAMVGLKAL